MVGCCRRPGRGTNTGLAFVGLQGSGSLRPEAPRVAEVCLFPACVPYGCHRLAHHRARSHVRFVNDGFGTVRMCFDGGVDANVYTWFSVGTGMNGVIDRLFYNASCIEDSRVFLIFCFSPGGSGWSFCPAALSLLRGFGAAWSSVLEARTCLLSLSVLCVSLLLTVSSPLCCFRYVPGVCRRPGRGINTGLMILAYLRDLLLVLVCWCCRRPGRGKNMGLTQLAFHGDLRVW